ncbi:MAG: hypothetical protein MUC66_05165 [Methanolinea sp.]|jgi:uncharacterized Zn finger protein|nr:hypothetical protein [Methanolinea sp.]
MERIEEFHCPVCGVETEHQVVAIGRNPLARCIECGSVHPFSAAKEKKPVQVKAIVSVEGISRVCQVEMEPGEPCRLGDHLVAECGEEYIGVEVTSIERGESRVKKATSTEITTLWTRKVEEVAVRIALHTGRTTASLLIQVQGEEPFVVGEVYKAGQRRIRVSRIKVRGGGILWREGAKAEARQIKRIFAYPL